MKILIVDSNLIELERTALYIQKAYPEAKITTTDDGMGAVPYSLNNHVDAVYTEAQMPHISGFDVARLVRKFRPNAAVYLVCGTSEYLNMASRQSLCGYYLKPLTEDSLQKDDLLHTQQINHAPPTNQAALFPKSK